MPSHTVRMALPRVILAAVVALLAAGPSAGHAPVHAEGCGPAGPAPYLHTCNTQIVDANGNPVRLRALNWYGFDSNDYVAGGLHYYSYRTIVDRIKRLGFNTLRIPLSNELVERNPVVSDLPSVCVNSSCLPVPGTTDTPITGAYLLRAISDTVSNNGDLVGLRALDILKTVVDYAGQQGLYVILDDHRSEAGWNPEENGLWYTSVTCPATAAPYTCYSAQSWLDDWQMLGTVFKDDPYVTGMDLRNEPHSAHQPSTCADYIASAHWGPCGTTLPNNNPDTDWPQWAGKAGNLLLTINPRWLMVVEGVSTYPQSNASFPQDGWGENLQGVAVDPVQFVISAGSDHLVYSPHDYRFSNTNNNVDVPTMIAAWNRNFGYIIATPAHGFTAPLWVGEYGTCTGVNTCIVDTAFGSGGTWFSAFQNYLDNGDNARGIPGGISWSYWPVNGTYSDGYMYGGAPKWQTCYGQREIYGYLGADWTTLSSTLLYSTTFDLPVQGTPAPPTQWPSYTCKPYTSSTPSFPTPVPATSTPVPPTATATPTNTPQPTATATATNTPPPSPTSTNTPPPTATNTPPPTATNTPPPSPTNTPIPPTPTSTNTPLPTVTSTRVPTTAVPPAATATRTVRPTAAPTRTATPTRTVAPPLTVTAARSVTSGGTLQVRVHTAARARVTVTLQVVVKTVKIERKKGHKPVKRTITTMPYRVVRTDTADKRGLYATGIRVTYKPVRAVAASLIASARTPRGSATHTEAVTILPPPRAIHPY